MVLYHWSQSTRLVREGALGPLSFIYERQYTEQFVDNQQEQKTVNLAELKQSDLELYDAGVKYIKEHFGGKVPSLKSLKAERDQLLQMKDAQY